jgi:hypothetical protein
MGDGSVYVTGVTADNQNDAVLLKFDASGTLVWERAWGGAASDEGLAVATASDGICVYRRHRGELRQLDRILRRQV